MLLLIHTEIKVNPCRSRGLLVQCCFLSVRYRDITRNETVLTYFHWMPSNEHEWNSKRITTNFAHEQAFKNDINSWLPIIPVIASTYLYATPSSIKSWYYFEALVSQTMRYFLCEKIHRQLSCYGTATSQQFTLLGNLTLQTSKYRSNEIKT